jgi:hypothetical protein
MRRGTEVEAARRRRELLEAAEIPVEEDGRRREGPGLSLWVRWATYDALVRYRRGEEPLNNTLARLIRFVRRMRPAAEARAREEFLL